MKTKNKTSALSLAQDHKWAGEKLARVSGGSSTWNTATPPVIPGMTVMLWRVEWDGSEHRRWVLGETEMELVSL